ncbi:MAG: glutamate-cysteine ligase family protein [Nitrososphaerales archaeon]
MGATFTYRTLEVLGPEHEFSVVGEDLRVKPIVDKIIRDLNGRVVNSVRFDGFIMSKELQSHVLEVKPSHPFRSPKTFEEMMYGAVLKLTELLRMKYGVSLLGTGMHPTLKLEETSIWRHRHKHIYDAYGRIFNLRQHGWLNIQSFQLNLPYLNEKDAILMHNLLANVCAYLPAVAASSPIYEGRFGEFVDNRLHFYIEGQKEVPTVVGNVVPEYASSFKQYNEDVIGRYSLDLAKAGAHRCLINKEWVNSRGVILRFDRRAIEIRVMDEQECIKSDVALSSFLRALLRGLMREDVQLMPIATLIEDFKSVVRFGLNAEVSHPLGPTSRDVCKHLLQIAWRNATHEEKGYLHVIERRLEEGNLSEVIKRRVYARAQKTDFGEAVVDVYSNLSESLVDNEPYF